MSRSIGNIPANEMITASDVAGFSVPASGLTDAELRAAPVAVDVFDWPAVQSFNLLDFVNGNGARVKATTPLSNDYGLVTRNIPSGSQTVDGTVAVSNFPQTQPVSGTVAVSNLPATQPVSGTVTVANPTANPETGLAKNATLTDGTQKTQVTNFPATQPVSGPLTDTQLRASNVGVSVANFPATQPVSFASLPAGSNRIGDVGVAALPALTDKAGASSAPIGAVSLGNSLGKTNVLLTGSLVTTATTANQVVLTYTVTAGKTLYLCYFDVAVRLTAYAATATNFGTASLQIGGSSVYTALLAHAGVITPQGQQLAEPIAIPAGMVVRWVCTPAAVTSFTWQANLGAYEK